MATTEQYLNSLIQDKTNLINAIKEKGVEVDDNATFTQLPDKVSEISGGGTPSGLEWVGKNAQLVDTYTKTYALSDTSFVVGGTTATSQKTILASKSQFYVLDNLDLTNKEIVVLQTLVVEPTYSSDVENNARQVCAIQCSAVSLFNGRGNVADTKLTKVSQLLSKDSYIYYSSTSALTSATSNIGLYGSVYTPSVGTSGGKNVVRISSPVLYSRASATNSSVENMQKVTDCSFKWSVNVYLIDEYSNTQSYVYKTMYELADEILSH